MDVAGSDAWRVSDFNPQAESSGWRYARLVLSWSRRVSLFQFLGWRSKEIRCNSSSALLACVPDWSRHSSSQAGAKEGSNRPADGPAEVQEESSEAPGVRQPLWCYWDERTGGLWNQQVDGTPPPQSFWDGECGEWWWTRLRPQRRRAPAHRDDFQRPLQRPDGGASHCPAVLLCLPGKRKCPPPAPQPCTAPLSASPNTQTLRWMCVCPAFLCLPVNELKAVLHWASAASFALSPPGQRNAQTDRTAGCSAEADAGEVL